MSSVDVSELRYVLERQRISQLWIKNFTVKREILVKLWAEIMLKFQWQIETLSPEIGFGPEFVSTSLLNIIKNGIDQAAKS